VLFRGVEIPAKAGISLYLSFDLSSDSYRIQRRLEPFSRFVKAFFYPKCQTGFLNNDIARAITKLKVTTIPANRFVWKKFLI
jgi:hypothetical protein